MALPSFRPGKASVPAPAPTWKAIPYRRVGQVVLDANGAGTAQVFPGAVDWVITARSVSIAPVAGVASAGATAREYLDAPSDAAYLQGTYDGVNDSSPRRQLLQPGQVLYVVWEDGRPGALATFRVDGLAYPPGQGAANL